MLVNATEFRNTYRFSEPLNLIPPYSLSLTMALSFVGIGTWSLLQNGVSAADGSFLQIVKSNAGRIEMEELVIKGSAEGQFASKELLDLKIRYRELVDAKGMGTGRAAFGMEERRGHCGTVRRPYNRCRPYNQYVAINSRHV